jgi:hypothetical protein
VILITTDQSSLSGTIPTEIGQLTELTRIDMGKYDGCLRSFHALFFIYKLTYFSSFLVNRSQFNNDTIVIHRHDIVHFLRFLLRQIQTRFLGPFLRKSDS